MENIQLDPFESISRHRVVSSNMAIDQRWQQHLSLSLFLNADLVLGILSLIKQRYLI